MAWRRSRVRAPLAPSPQICSGFPYTLVASEMAIRSRVVILTRGYTERMEIHPWPTLPDEDRWLTDAMEDRLRETNQSVEELRARARELRIEAGQSDMKGTREAALALADRYEQVATARMLA